MALTLNTRYGTRATEPSIDYPTGSFKNKSAPDAVDGTPLERDWANDLLGARDAILKAAGILANGAPETAEASQVLEALNTIYKSLATESVAGISRKATIDEAQSLFNDVSFLTPKKLNDAFSGGNQGGTTAGAYQRLPGGWIMQNGQAETNSSGFAIVNWPVAFLTALVGCVATTAGDGGGNPGPVGNAWHTGSQPGLNGMTFYNRTPSGASGTVATFKWIAIGF